MPRLTRAVPVTGAEPVVGRGAGRCVAGRAWCGACLVEIAGSFGRPPHRTAQGQLRVRGTARGVSAQRAIGGGLVVEVEHGAARPRARPGAPSAPPAGGGPPGYAATRSSWKRRASRTRSHAAARSTSSGRAASCRPRRLDRSPGRRAPPAGRPTAPTPPRPARSAAPGRGARVPGGVGGAEQQHRPRPGRARRVCATSAVAAARSTSWRSSDACAVASRMCIRSSRPAVTLSHTVDHAQHQHDRQDDGQRLRRSRGQHPRTAARRPAVTGRLVDPAAPGRPRPTSRTPARRRPPGASELGRAAGCVEQRPAAPAASAAGSPAGNSRPSRPPSSTAGEGRQVAGEHRRRRPPSPRPARCRSSPRPVCGATKTSADAQQSRLGRARRPRRAPRPTPAAGPEPVANRAAYPVGVAVAGDQQPQARAGLPATSGHAAEQHVEPLARLVDPAEEEHRCPAGRAPAHDGSGPRRRNDAVHTPFGITTAGPTDVALHGGERVLATPRSAR